MVLLSEAIRQLEQDGIPWQAVTAVRLLMLTGARRNEGMTLMWEYVDFEHSLLRLPDSKTGQKSIPLAPPALAVLSALPRSGQWVFPAVRGDGYYKGIQKIWEQLRRRADLIALEQAEATGTPLNQVPSLAGVRIHDLRHSFASFAAADGASLFLIGKVLGHKQARTTWVLPFHSR